MPAVPVVLFLVPQPNRWAGMGFIIKLNEDKSMQTVLRDRARVIAWSDKSLLNGFASCVVVRGAPVTEDIKLGFSYGHCFSSFVMSGLKI